ncbi:MAG: hypothetical protein MUC39_05930 [Candidatus Omnitrophica bacterium]|jgi:phosphate:Na+ symporter|nr:hypothetical protein [Candidatus Omnitrophota bacterium]
MKGMPEIKTEISVMSKAALAMFELTHRAFMEHNMDLIAEALTEETKLNDFEKEIISDLVFWGRGCAEKEEKLKATTYADVVGDLELIGDYCKDILERVQIKIEEKLLFSEDAVKEYNNLYVLTSGALQEITDALEKDDLSLVKEVLKNQEHIDTLIDGYRREHNQRLIEGICTPLACNMFLNMLDFTAAIYYHAKKIARNLLKIK